MMSTTMDEVRGQSRLTIARRGIALIYLAMAMVLLVALLAFALDIGRLHLVKTQLQATADGAARAAALSVTQQTFNAGTGAVNNTAVAASSQDIASQNVLDGRTGSANASVIDTVIGYWSTTSRTFTAASGFTDYIQSNAVHVTVYCASSRGNAVSQSFALVLGRGASRDESADAIAMASGYFPALGSGYGVFGVRSVDIKGNDSTNSYDPTKPYGTTNRSSNGGVASDGLIKMNGNTTVRGDARWGPANSPYSTGGPSGGTVTGLKQALPEMVNFPSVQAPASGAYDNAAIKNFLDTANPPNFSAGNTTAVNVPAGTYYVNDLSLQANVTLNVTSGPVVFIVKGNVSLQGGTDTLSGLPGDLTIDVMPGANSTVDLGGGNNAYLHLYAPDSDITTDGNNELFGWMIGKTVTMKGTNNVHYDGTTVSDGNPGHGKYTIALVK